MSTSTFPKCIGQKGAFLLLLFPSLTFSFSEIKNQHQFLCIFAELFCAWASLCVCVCKTPMHPRYTAWQVIFTFQCVLENFSISRRAASLSFSWFHNIPLYKYIGHNTYVYFPNHLSLENFVLPPILTPKLIRQRNWLELIWNYLL